MPSIVIGADTPLGVAVVDALRSRHGEIRAFVSDPAAAKRLKKAGVKVAIGDVSDGSHIGSAAAGCFSAIIVPEVAFDGRERSFSHSPAATITTWASALAEAAVIRLIWLEDSRVPTAVERFTSLIPEVGVVATSGRSPVEIAAETVRIDDLDSV